MKKIFFFGFVLATIGLCCLIISYKKNPLVIKSKLAMLPAPTEGEENEELREKYDSLRHRTAPEVDWKMIEMGNMMNANKIVVNKLRSGTHETSATFAGGLLRGEWQERGARNLTGNIKTVDYVPATNTLYTISNGGTLWKSTLGSGNWAIQNQGTRFDVRLLKAFTKIAGGTRIITFANQTLQYSDDDGATFTSSNINFPVAWGGNYIANMVRLNDGSNTIYCLAYLWDPTPWNPRYWLFRSTDEGQSFTRLALPDASEVTLTLCNPYNSNDVYVADINSIQGYAVMYNIVGATATQTYTSFIGYGTSMPSVNEAMVFKGNKIGGVTTLYAMMNDNSFFKSTDLGASWTQQGSYLYVAAWDQMDVSMDDPAKIFYGEVNAHRSSDSGGTWAQVNDWSEYYGDPATKIHADIMWMQHFRKQDGSAFMIVDSHGGVYVSYDELNTVSNLSLTSQTATEYYDVLTDTLNPNRIFVGSQDQGLQRTLTGTTPGIQDFVQVISGDYGHLCLTYNNQVLWPQYPGGTFYLYNNLGAAVPIFIGSYSMQGDQKPNAGWILPSISTVNAAANEIWIGGGNINGGDGSFLSKLSMDLNSGVITASQFPFDFRANSNSSYGGITAIEQSHINPSQLYVATEDGTFFYSNDAGSNWTKTNSFNGPTPWYLYGSAILASHITPNLVWFGGSGYSNDAVYESHDGGATFTSITNGLPGTLVEQIVANPTETMLFAATDAGPYVYIRSQSQWYSMQDANNPVQFYNSVEYIASSNIVRFGTMGRGIWDFVIANDVLPVALLDFSGTLVQNTTKLQWQTTSEINAQTFVVQRSVDGINFNNVGSVAANGNSNTLKNYNFNDVLSSTLLQQPVIYYRLQIIDKDGKTSLSKIISIKLGGENKGLIAYPNPMQSQLNLQLTTQNGTLAIKLFDGTGKLVIQKELQAQSGTTATSLNTSNLAKGNYFLQVTNGSNKWTQTVLKN